MLKRRLTSWLFAMALLFGQAAAFAHALTHLHAHDTALSDKACEVCVAQAQLGAAAPPAEFVLAIPLGETVHSTRLAPLCVDLAPRPACARAPPVSADT